MNDDTRTSRLEALIAAYGTDKTRWPAADRARFAGEADLDGLAGSREARALDHLLDEAANHRPAPAPDALIETILASARADESPAVDLQPAQVNSGHIPARTRKPTHLYRAPAAAAALMAASLAVGLFVGSLTTTQTTVAQIGTLAGLDLGATTATTTFEDDFLATDEEEIL